MGHGDDGAGELRDDLLEQLPLVGVEVGLGLVQEEEAGSRIRQAANAASFRCPPESVVVGQRQVVLVEAEPDEQALRLAGETGATRLDPSIEGRLLVG